MKEILSTMVHVILGLVIFLPSVMIARTENHPKKWTSFLFYFILGFIFALGDYIPSFWVGILVLLLALLALFKQVAMGKLQEVPVTEREASAVKYGWKVFLPAVTLAIVAVVVGQFTPFGGIVGIMLGSMAGLLVAFGIYRYTWKNMTQESAKITQQVGLSAFLPQLLAALGAVFNKVQVGDIIASLFQGLEVGESKLLAVTVYFVAMATFTIFMGNAFAAFTVITAGIGIPFVFAQGANPAFMGMLALTAGYCGTLMTPMAANFNILPISLLEIDSKLLVIQKQVPIALLMLFLHIVIAYFFAF